MCVNVAILAFRFHRSEVTDIANEVADELLQRDGSLPVMLQVVALR